MSGFDPIVIARRAAASVYAGSHGPITARINEAILAGERDDIGLVQAALAGIREAAAPELFEALFVLLDRVDLMDMDSTEVAHFASAQSRARAALRKATGAPS